MSEPVKLVIEIRGGMVLDVLSCGVPIRAVIIDYDTEPDDSDAVQVPQPFAGTDSAFAWEILVTEDQPAHALALFNAGCEEANPTHPTTEAA